MIDKQLEDLKEQLPAALTTWQQSEGRRITVGWLHVANPEVIAILLTGLEKAPQLIRQVEVRGVEKLAAAFKSWSGNSTHLDYEAQRHWTAASEEALSFADDLSNQGDKARISDSGSYVEREGGHYEER
ncbi:hypothetical protein RJ492_004530 [Pluralibacter gergoviae]|uniref:hypothetical protein n=1 Tax=Enterobacterales TaxID=91347 RepID=UPI0007CD27BC|nr:MULTISPECIES: hypothetical protein [Enterobacterales]EKV9909470.1 hypothetical protein [Pluralibacter gergoviae]SAQ03198.1 Uncharacterised protein [Klebsiella oxytoca]HBX4000072.1 hypothetical protein [Klebsiella variicola]ELD4333524.1 hypothetical protein [Pluralibacter gergoviae]MBZ6860900.1 hypothetical protein [Klebsiella michiganensis]